MIIDSYAWIEYFIGSAKGERVKKILEKEKCFTSIFSISEIIEWCLKNNKTIEKRLELIKSQSGVIVIDERIAMLAAKINYERKKTIAGWGMADSMILATALINDMRVVTGDKHFSDIKNAIMI
ncbi:MAG: PIN domain-containing protein [Candidatus Aenigmatarchaeota archaeon]